MCSCLCIPIQYHIYERNTDLFPSPMDGKPATDSALRPDILAKGRRWQTTQGLFHLEKLPTEQLVKIGHRFANNPEQPDSALLALTIVTNRYDKSMSREDKILVQQAQRMKGFVYLFRYYDYAKAYDCLLHAQDVAEEIDFISPATALNLGHIFSTIGDQTGDHTVKRKPWTICAKHSRRV